MTSLNHFLSFLNFQELNLRWMDSHCILVCNISTREGLGTYLNHEHGDPLAMGLIPLGLLPILVLE